MIGGINSGNTYTGSAPPARERSDAARAPAARPELLTDERAQTRAQPAGQQQAPSADDGEGYQRRVQARAAVADSRLQPFLADDIPLANSQAVEAFISVANYRDGLEGYDAGLAGIDIRV